VELITVPTETIRSIWHKLCDLYLSFGKFPQQICESHDANYQRNSKTFSLLSSISSSLTQGGNCIQIDPQLATLTFLKLLQIQWKHAVLNLALCSGAIWRRREKPQYVCTTTVPQVH